jgi:hypothetical protein
MFRVKNKTVGSMATFPGRFNILRDVVKSIAPQLDQLFIYVNTTTEGIPDFTDLPHVTVLDGREYAGDLSARGKIYPLKFMTDCVVFTLDDDFVYPHDYVSQNMYILNRFHGRCMTTTHGSIMPPKVDWYYERTGMMMSIRRTDHLQLCTLAGSGTACFDQRTLPLDLDDLLKETMVDLQMSIAARDAGLPIWVLPRPEGWLHNFKTDGLFQAFSQSGLTPHTYLARPEDWSFDIYARIARNAMERAEVTAAEIGLDPELAVGLITGELPANWRQGRVGYEKRRDYLNFLLTLAEQD